FSASYYSSHKDSPALKVCKRTSSPHAQYREFEAPLVKIRPRLHDGTCVAVVVNLSQIHIERLGVAIAPANFRATGGAEFCHRGARNNARLIHKRKQRPVDYFIRYISGQVLRRNRFIRNRDRDILT